MVPTMSQEQRNSRSITKIANPAKPAEKSALVKNASSQSIKTQSFTKSRFLLTIHARQFLAFSK